MPSITNAQVKTLVGKTVYAVKKDGGRVSGKLVRISGNRLFIQPVRSGKNVKTKAIVPLVLFDLLAIGTSPYAYGYPGYGYPGYGVYGYPGFFW
jgi:hypothetical protein